MKAGRNADFEAFRPDRVIIMRAVQAQGIVPDGITTGLGRFARHRRNLTPNQARQHGHLKALALDELQLFNRLLRGKHRHHRSRSQAVFQAGELIGRIHIKCATGCPPHLIIAQKRRKQRAAGRVDHPEVDAELIQALVQQLGQHCGRAVARILGRHPPPGRLEHPPILAFLFGESRPFLIAKLVGNLAIALGHTLSPDLVQIVHGRRLKLDPVTVRVNDRMAQFGVNLLGCLV